VVKLIFLFFIYLLQMTYLLSQITCIVLKKLKKKKKHCTKTHTPTLDGPIRAQVFFSALFHVYKSHFFFLQFFYMRLYAHKSMSRFPKLGFECPCVRLDSNTSNQFSITSKSKSNNGLP
jgi:hypothetical protein